MVFAPFAIYQYVNPFTYAIKYKNIKWRCLIMAVEKKTRNAYKNMLKHYPDVMNIKQVCEALGNISTKTGCKLIRDGKLDGLLVGNKYVVAKINVIDFLMKQK